MNGIHDVGGADGFGPIHVEEDEVVWHADWEKALFSFFPQAAMAGYFNLDEFRASMERIHPVNYLTSTYYEHWLHAFEEYLTRDDANFPAEAERRTAEYLEDPSKPLPETVNQELADTMAAFAYAGAPTRRENGRAPQFAVGNRVVVSSTVPVGHTRKAGYVRGATGEITIHHGVFVYPDTNALGEGEAPEHVYTVRFSAEDLFGKGIGDPTVSISIDLWEPYLSRASA
jgi:nitrile hydratase beta subunit